MKGTLALAIAFLALAVIVLLFAGAHKHTPPQQLSLHSASATPAKSTTNNSLSSLFSPLAAANNPELAVSVLDDDLDNDGNPDGLADPLVVLGEGASDNGLPRVFSPLAVKYSAVSVSVLDNDQDHDGNLIVLSVISVLAAFVSSNLLLAVCEVPKLSSIWLLLLERPG